VECLVEPLAAFGVCGERTALFLQDDGLRWGRADHCRTPPERGWAPMGWARGAAIVAKQERFEAKLHGLQSAEGLVTGPAEVAYGFVFPRGDRDGGEGARACQPGPWPGVSPRRCDAVPSRCGQEGGRHAPAVVAFFPALPLEPLAPGASLRDKAEGVGLRWHFPDALIDIALPGPKGAQVRHLRARVLGASRPGNRLLVDLHAHAEGARLRQG
jgi:hypothetical protein